ncbi:MAG: tripartite tricarboxylate transporter TctB family protein [Pyramidobacter sp.]|uniref:tripartite tricarboxylate transporter TctB family protein n=1 Tax=Pyramidobacter sp. TaxID=1943581 RepID=UPI002A8106FC|nr:tripartite tricarboxylate transporter TctB family protein [Pyramidobacter sp.]MDY4033205.1 tripartite tricarboxylate transporter TctB family protein [Pyramidobacter sp.]
MFERNDRYLGLLSIICGIIGYLAASKWKILMAADPLGPSGVPKILSLGFVILGIILMGGTLFLSTNTKKERENSSRQNFSLIFLLVIICFAYLVLLPYIGYLLATPLLILGVLIAIGGIPLKTVLSVSILGTIVLFIVFYSLLKVNLPLGFTKEYVALLPLRF